MGKIFAGWKGLHRVFFHRVDGDFIRIWGVRGDSTGHNGSALLSGLARRVQRDDEGRPKWYSYILEFSTFHFHSRRPILPRVRNEFLLGTKEKNLIESVSVVEAWKIICHFLKNAEKWLDSFEWYCVNDTIGTSYRVVQYLYVAKLICKLREMVMCIVINH